MNLKTYIFVHNQEIILDFMGQKKFNNFNDLTYVFLGNKNIDKIENLDNVIICRNLKYNLEDYPKLTSFSGWYALWKNNLINSEYFNLFEYDINTTNDIQEKISDLFKTGNKIIGYIPLSTHHSNYIDVEKWIIEIKKSIKKNYNIEIESFIKSVIPPKIVSMTSNHSFHKTIFDSYMNWIEPMIDDIKISQFSGHEVERSISLFYILNEIDFIILENSLEHFQLDSHETQEIERDKFFKNYNRLVNNTK